MNKFINKLVYFGAAVIFLNTVTSCKNEVSLAVCGTTKSLAVGATTAKIEGYIRNDGNSESFTSGVCYATHPNPTLNDATAQNSINQLLPFQLTLTELNPMTRYYARSFVKNEKGVSYGNVVTFRTGDKEIGQEYQGGNIYYILQPGDFGYDSLQCHGLICCNYAFTSNLAFSDVNYFNGAISKSIGSGKSNTDLIINNQGDDAKAAAYCSKFDIGGYDDWFLPSLNELERLLESQVNMPINSDYSLYVSSTEDNEYNVFISQLQDVTGYYYYYNNNIKPNQQLIKTVRSSVYYKNAYYYQTAWPVRMF
jgi:hypothetical protein